VRRRERHIGTTELRAKVVGQRAQARLKPGGDDEASGRS
jgi:hypothetical protein